MSDVQRRIPGGTRLARVVNRRRRDDVEDAFDLVEHLVVNVVEALAHHRIGNVGDAAALGALGAAGFARGRAMRGGLVIG